MAPALRAWAIKVAETAMHIRGGAIRLETYSNPSGPESASVRVPCAGSLG